MTFKQLTLVFWGIVLSLVLLLLSQVLWLRLLAIGALTGLLAWAFYANYAELRTGQQMLSFRLRYRLEDGAAIPAEWGEFLHNLAQESGHVVVTLLQDKQTLHLFLEAHRIYETAVAQGLNDTAVLPGGECVRTRGNLAEVAMQRREAYALVWPQTAAEQAGRARRGKPGIKKGAAAVSPEPVVVGGAIPAVPPPTDIWSRELLAKLLAVSGSGEIRWHIFPRQQGLVVIGGTKQLLQEVRTLAHTQVRRIPPLVWHLPATLHPLIMSMAAFLRRLYWWFPLRTTWDGGVAKWLGLPPTAQHPRLDSDKVRLALPADYVTPTPLLVLGHDQERQQAVGLELAAGVTTHLAVLGGQEAAAQFGLALVEQALRLGLSVVAVGNHFDGLGTIYSGLPEAQRTRVYRLSPLTENPLPLSLLSPQGGQEPDLASAMRWLEEFLAIEGITMTAQRPAVQLCKSLACIGLARNPDFGLADLARDMQNPAQVAAQLQGEVAATAPEDVRAFLLEEGRQLDQWALRSYATLLAQKLPMLGKVWVLRAVTGPYANLRTLLAQGGAVFGSLPLQADPGSRQFARYLLQTTRHALAIEPPLARPLLLYLEDFPLYLSAALNWAELRRQNCLVVLNCPEGTSRDTLTTLLGANAELFVPLVLQSGERGRDAAEVFGLPPEALHRLKGRMAVLRQPYRDSTLTCTINVLETAPMAVTEWYSEYGPKPTLAGVASEAPAGVAADTPAAGGPPLLAVEEEEEGEAVPATGGLLAQMARPLLAVEEEEEGEAVPATGGLARLVRPQAEVAVEREEESAAEEPPAVAAPVGSAKAGRRALPEPTAGKPQGHRALGLPDLPES